MTTRTTESDRDDDPGRDPVAPDEPAAEVPDAGAWLFVGAVERDYWPVI